MSRKGKKEPDWARARIVWEATPSMTQADVARLLDVSKMAVTRRIKAEGWKKVQEIKAAAGIVQRRAQDRADQRTADLGGSNPAPLDGGDAPTEHPHASANPAPSAASIEVAIEARAKIIERHRREWDGARNHIYKAIQNSDFDKAKLGKITAEALQIVQNGERKAWGLDKDEEKTVKLVYEDSEGDWND